MELNRQDWDNLEGCQVGETLKNITAMMDLGYPWMKYKLNFKDGHPSRLRMPPVMMPGIVACLEPSEEDRKQETC